ncbi:hypothetical protein PROFUN_12451 [Planoprotostelium fungivorum]|uniref:Uncharacterized protein n=1 Tax=Planoprotostelium fungivorum TaxID=1890364 RepID=A0A2P6N7B9_9EUKA|nr:hypothetical protein PROFUN_12451 [Planoprotostelium fungivorum]
MYDGGEEDHEEVEDVHRKGDPEHEEDEEDISTKECIDLFEAPPPVDCLKSTRRNHPRRYTSLKEACETVMSHLKEIKQMMDLKELMEEAMRKKLDPKMTEVEAAVYDKAINEKIERDRTSFHTVGALLNVKQ